MNKDNPLFYQLFESESSTYTYLIADPLTKEAALIDPVIETIERDLKLIEELGVKLKYILDTHIHADHITAAGELRKRTGAKSAVSATAKVDCVDIALTHGQELALGEVKIKALSTPGHTNTCMSFVCGDRVFTGDALLIRGTGRTDFQQGSSEKLYDSVHQQLFSLPEKMQVYPGHDYRGQTASTIELEKKFNPRLGLAKSKSDFIQTMAELKLANPKKIHEAVPANMACGITRDEREIHPSMNDGLPEVSVQKVHEALGKVRLIDVRNPDEFNNELGHIQGAELIPLGPALTRFLENGERSQEIVFVCRSGGRSGQATTESIKQGYKFTSNMVGGMLQWNDLKYRTEKN
ncbi:MAG: MBL fold metallo-hydrolase [Bdellovibrionaceae bacterium]|nr:MBL fold metallo-hydrolase [Pseudobdellovibrionaceae bacterium]